jgi:LPS sulfotransferase NodH
MWGISSQASVHEYLEGVLNAGTTRNGVFGAKIHWSQFRHLVWSVRGKVGHDMLEAATTMAQCFPALRYVWLRRRDKARQAISYLKAIQTNRWWVVAGNETSDNPLPSFDFDAISRFEEMLTVQETCWDQYFKGCKAGPLVIFYEDLVRSYRSTVLEVLRYLRISAAENFPIEMPALVRQADETSERWLEQYQDKKRK